MFHLDAAEAFLFPTASNFFEKKVHAAWGGGGGVKFENDFCSY